MAGALHAGFVVRYLMGSPTDSGWQASDVIDSVEELETSGIALAITAFVLSTVSRHPEAGLPICL